MRRARALVLIVPLLAVVASLQLAGHPEPQAVATVRPAQLVATTTSTTTTSTTVAPTTTTTAPPVTTPPPVHQTHKAVHRVHTASATTATGWPCGGDLPPCWVLHRENPPGDPTLWNGGCHAPVGYAGPGPCGGSTASGLWQFLRSTWANFRGYLNAADAPPEVQNAKARELWAGGRGCSHWSAC